MGVCYKASLIIVLRAGLDVFENEPDIHPGLTSSRNVVRDLMA